MSEYESVDGEVLAAWSRTHKNDEKTRVTVVDVGGSFLAFAVDVDTDGEVIAAEFIDSSLTDNEAVKKAQLWNEENPKGIKGDGLIGRLFGD